jgi:transposase
MIGLPSSVPIRLFREAADMRKGVDGLCGLVVAAGEDIYSGALYVFMSRRRSRVKILTFSTGGFVVWYKRLERGRFRHPRAGEDDLLLDATQLTMLLDGIDLGRVERPNHWRPRVA